jgi:hypothetical protein
MDPIIPKHDYIIMHNCTMEIITCIWFAHGFANKQFDAALKELQVTLNIVRSNEPGIDRDTWLPFKELYLGIYMKYQ